MARGFQPGKKNIYSKLKEEVSTLKAALEFERSQRPALEKFTDEVGRSLMFILSQKPMREWPPEAKTAFHYEAKQAPSIADLYKNRMEEVHGA